MTTETADLYAAGTSPDDFLEPDDPIGPGEPAGQEDAPYGYTTDPATGQPRPKIKPGRPRKPPTADELAAAPAVPREQDRPPAPPQPPGRGRGHSRTPDDRPDPPMPKGGVIAKGVNKLYRQAGKAMRALDYDIGQGIIECTRAEDDDDVTVGEAWEELCKTNPRIRRFILRCIEGGAYGQLLIAHLPIGMAIVMKPWFQRQFMGRLVESMAEPDEDTPEGEGGLPGGMTAADAEEMRAMAEQQMRKMAAKMGHPVSEADLKAARAAADQLAGNGTVRRAQPKRSTRAQRAGK